ncbi:TIGR01459 family HAD-type hydrolase [Candidatus Pelagibacter bacterium nBUS_33]|uniref:TIGR01459 family HAD-type hydrolase n=1 Tax=Candidatus Pelagibacter bacterium nBUS_33 TaxID=3374193 RepID=UPI003EB763B1
MLKVKFDYLIKRFDCFLFDQWGVLHDGKKKFKFIDKTLTKLKQKSKCSIILSNTSQNEVEAKRDTLKKLKIDELYFDKVITSGGYLEHIAFSKNKKFLKFNNLLKLKKCYLISNKNKNEVINNIGLKKSNIKSAKFILAMSVKPFENIDKYKKVLKQLFKRNLTMICSNPDKFVFDGKVKKFVLQVGAIAEYYNNIGGKVIYIGKPHKEIYNYALKNLNFKKNRVLMIGDNTQTDILGARNYGIKSVLVIDGYNKNEKNFYKNKSLKVALDSASSKSNYIIKNISI